MTPNVFTNNVPFKMLLIEEDMRRRRRSPPGRRYLRKLLQQKSSDSPGPPCCALCPYDVLSHRYNLQNYGSKGEPFGGIFGSGNVPRDGPWGPTRYINNKVWP
jgi:hypothetical protein